MIQKPFQGKASIKRTFNSLTIEIPATKQWFAIIFLLFWLCGWAAGEAFAIYQVFFSDTPIFVNLFMLVWLTLWTFGGGAAIFSLIWQLQGVEIITFERGILSLEKSIGFYSWKKQYDMKSIRQMELNSLYRNFRTNSGNNLNSVVGGGRLQFDYGMKTIKFAGGIDEAEARTILQHFKENDYTTEENFGSEL